MSEHTVQRLVRLIHQFVHVNKLSNPTNDLTEEDTVLEDDEEEREQNASSTEIRHDVPATVGDDRGKSVTIIVEDILTP